MWRFELSFSKSPPAYFQGSGLGSRSSPPSLCVVPLTGFPLLLWVPTSLQPCSLSRWESQLMVALLSILPGDGSQEAEVCLSRRSSSQGGPGNCALLLPTPLHPPLDFPSCSAVKNPRAVQELWERWVQSLGGSEDPLEEEMAPTPVFLPGKAHGQRSPVGYRL